MTPRPDAVLLDLDETLCRVDPPPSAVLPRAFADVGVEPCFTAAEYDAIVERYMDDFETKAERRAHCFADLAERHGQDRDLGFAVAEAYTERREHSEVVWLDGARDALDTLADRRPLGLVTNGEPAMQDPKLEALDLRPSFETVVYAGHETRAKPHPEPFEVALADLGHDPERALYVGNSLASDVEGARNAGIPVAWLDHEGVPDPTPTPDYRIESMAELPALLGV